MPSEEEEKKRREEQEAEFQRMHNSPFLYAMGKVAYSVGQLIWIPVAVMAAAALVGYTSDDENPEQVRRDRAHRHYEANRDAQARRAHFPYT